MGLVSTRFCRTTLVKTEEGGISSVTEELNEHGERDFLELERKEGEETGVVEFAWSPT